MLNRDIIKAILGLVLGHKMFYIPYQHHLDSYKLYP